MFTISDYVLSVVANGTISQAARQLHLSQPALSVAIKKLERQIGQPLFDRSTTPLTLTPAGELYVAKARQITLLEQSFRDELVNADQHLTGSLTIGGAFISVTYLLPPVLRQFHERYPDVELTLLETPFPELTRRLLDQQVDLGVDADRFLHPKIDAVQLFENHILLAVPDQLVPQSLVATSGYSYDEVLAGSDGQMPIKRLALATFAALPFILMLPANEISQRTAGMFAAAKFHPRVAMTVNQQMSAYEFAQRGWGAAFVTNTLIQYSGRVDGLHFYQLTGADQPRYVAVAFNKQRYQSKLQRTFVDFLVRYYQHQAGDDVVAQE